MFVLDSLLVGGLRFVLEKIAAVADGELNDPERWRAELVELQMRLENGEIDEDEFAERERVILARLRDLHPTGGAVVAGAEDIASVEVEMAGDDEEPRR